MIPQPTFWFVVSYLIKREIDLKKLFFVLSQLCFLGQCHLLHEMVFTATNVKTEILLVIIASTYIVFGFFFTQTSN